MAGTFVIGEEKVRPGAYFNISRNDSNTSADIVNGVTAVVFKADFGPLLDVRKLNADTDYGSIYGTGLTTDAIKEAVAGGAKEIIACRVGHGGTNASIDLNDKDGEAAVKISAMYPGDKKFAVTIREKITDSLAKECIIYTGTKEFVKFAFPAGEGEAAAVAEGLAKSESFAVSLVSGKEKAELANISQETFTKGENPEVTTEDYSDAFAAIEPYVFNTICVDTEDTVIHLLLAAFLNRIFEAGSLAQGVVAEKYTVDLDKRIEHALGFNDEKMHYVLNARVNEEGKEIDGYQTAARIAGMIGACASNSSLTHTVINGFTDILERLTNTQIVDAEKKGCLVLSVSSKNQVWIDNAINTLTVFTEDKDEGWRKIRRVKTRFELTRRVNDITDDLVGKVDNDSNGRKTIVSQIQGVGKSMVEEGKLVSCTVTESTVYTADGDSAWFNIDVIDKDSAEHLYMMFRFQFSTNE